MHYITLNKDHHNGHPNEKKTDFDRCVPLMVHCESEEEAKRVAQHVSSLEE